MLELLRLEYLPEEFYKVTNVFKNVGYLKKKSPPVKEDSMLADYAAVL
jgi:hypothetical protein